MGKFCSDCKYYNPIDNFVGTCNARENKPAWIEHPGCEHYEKEKASE